MLNGLLSLILMVFVLTACTGKESGDSPAPPASSVFNAEFQFPANDLLPGDGTRTVEAIGILKCVDASTNQEVDVSKCSMPSTKPTVVQKSPAGLRDTSLDGATNAKEEVPEGSTVWVIKPDTIVCDFTNGYTQVGVTCKIPGYESVYSAYSAITKTLACDGTETRTRTYVSCRDNITLAPASDTHCSGQTDPTPTIQHQSPAGVRIYNVAEGTQTHQCLAGAEKDPSNLIDVTCTQSGQHKSGLACLNDTYTATFRDPGNNKTAVCSGTETLTKVFDQCLRDHDNIAVNSTYCPTQTTSDTVTHNSPSGSRPVVIANSDGNATESCLAGQTSWTFDTASLTCLSGNHKNGLLCESDVIACATLESDALKALTGTRTWDSGGSVYQSCVASTCQDGHYLTGNSCSEVGVGYYSESVVTRTDRVQCPTNSSTASTTSNSMSSCLADAGYYDVGSKVFAAVGAGYYSTALNTQRTACAAGSFSDILTASSCQACSITPANSTAVTYSGSDSALTSNSCGYASITCDSGFTRSGDGCFLEAFIATFVDPTNTLAACDGSSTVNKVIDSCTREYNGNSDPVANSFCSGVTVPTVTLQSPAGTITASVTHGTETRSCLAGTSTYSVDSLTCESGYVANAGSCVSSIKVLVGTNYACYIKSGEMKCWGADASGQLGSGTVHASGSAAALPVAVPAGKQIISGSTGAGSTCVKTADGLDYCFGSFGQMKNFLGFSSSSTNATPILMSNFGSASFGQLVIGNNMYMIQNNGSVYTWGYNSTGEIGLSTTDGTGQNQILMSDALTGKTVVMISPLGSPCAIDSDGALYCWGSNSSGATGINVTTNTYAKPTAVTGGSLAGKTVKQVSTTTGGSCAIASDDWAHCWGSGSNGRLGNNGTTMSGIPVVVSQGTIPASTKLISIAVSGNTSCAIAEGGNLYCWGAGTNYQRGDNSTAAQLTPIQINTGALTGKKLVQVFGRANGFMAKDEAGIYYAWGKNTNGEIGDGTLTQPTVPVVVTNIAY